MARRLTSLRPTPHRQPDYAERKLKNEARATCASDSVSRAEAPLGRTRDRSARPPADVCALAWQAGGLAAYGRPDY